LPVDIFSQILYYKTVDDGRKCVVPANRISGNLLFINLCHELRRAKKQLLITSPILEI